MKSAYTVGKLVVLMMLAASSARASTILTVSGALVAGDPTQLGRLSRNAIAQDWTGGEPFPGAVNPTTAYHYHLYTVNVGVTPFIQVSFDSALPNTFVSAYDTAYVPTSPFATNWLGDPGLSGNFFGTDPQFFQVVVPTNHNLVIVVNQTNAGTLGLGDPFGLLVDGFIDTGFSDPPEAAPVPEPATLFLSASGLAMIARKRRARRA